MKKVFDFHQLLFKIETSDWGPDSDNDQLKAIYALKKYFNQHTRDEIALLHSHLQDDIASDEVSRLDTKCKLIVKEICSNSAFSNGDQSVWAVAVDIADTDIDATSCVPILFVPTF